MQKVVATTVKDALQEAALVAKSVTPDELTQRLDSMQAALIEQINNCMTPDAPGGNANGRGEAAGPMHVG